MGQQHVGAAEDFKASPERSAAMATFWLSAGSGIVLLAVAIIIWVYGYFFFSYDRLARSISLLVAITGSGLLIHARVRLSRANARFLWRLQEDAYSRVSQAIEDLDPTDLKTIINFNREQMDQYHALTKAQAADSYKRAQFAMFLGFLILTAGFGVTFGRQAGAAETYTTGALTALGTALSGFVAQTFLAAYRKALSQLTYFFEQPLVSSYLITAERLSSQLSSSKKDEALLRIIDRILSATISRTQGPGESGNDTPRSTAPATTDGRNSASTSTTTAP